MKTLSRLSCSILIAAVMVIISWGTAFSQPPQFKVAFSPSACENPVTGRVILLIAKSDQPEPRLRFSLYGPVIAGIDIDQLQPDESIVIPNNVLSYPIKLSELPPGDYFVQAVINVYQQVHRADGKTIWVPINNGRIEFFNTAAGNLYSDVYPVHFGEGGTVKIEVEHVIPKRPRPEDTKWLKRIKVQSKKLTEFWGHPIFIHATVLLPKGYEDHPDTYYPSIYTLGHSETPFRFTTEPPKNEDEQKGVNPATGLESGYATYKNWISDDFPRVIVITLQQQTPYFADSYSVNSANNGPYGDAVVEEVIPYLEKQFRIIGQPYARHVEGASTSGWQSLALILQNPDFFGGAWILQPDPIDFTSYITVNIYEDENAFEMPAGKFLTIERYFRRTTWGQPLLTMRQLSLYEAVLGTHGRSFGQLGAWEAVYGPVGDDGYPVQLWDYLTGEINCDVANYMRDNGYDLRVYAEKNWETIGPKLQGKLHFFCGDMDDFYLNLAVYKFEEFIKSTTNPKSDAEFTYGRPMKGHSWHAWTWAEFVRKVAAVIDSNKPAE